MSKKRRMKDVLLCKEKRNNYDENDILSIYHYAQNIVGKTFLSILVDAGLTNYDINWVKSKESDKGLPGKIVEASYFGYELNNRQNADFESVGVELKTTAADFNQKTSKYQAGETISITQIDFKKPVDTDFYSSHLYDKLKSMIVIFYYRNKLLESKLEYELIYANLFSPSKEDLAIIKSDYREINWKISNGMANTLSRKDGTYLSTAPKAKKESNMVQPYYGGSKITKRSYTLRKEYINVILNGYYLKEERLITDLRELEQLSFTQIIEKRFKEYIGYDIWDIAETLNYHAEQMGRLSNFNKIAIGEKNNSTLATITARLLGLKALNSEEFTKAGIRIKTVLFNSHGYNTQNLRLADVDFLEIYNIPDPFVKIEKDEDENEFQVIYTGWEDSKLYEILDNVKYLFVVFQEDYDGDIIFKGSKMWAMSDEDIEKAKLDWLDIKAILRKGVQLTIGADGRTYNNFPGVAKARCIHLRPHGEKAFYIDENKNSWGNGSVKDTEQLPDGRRMTRQSYWLNNHFVRDILIDLIDTQN